MKRILALTAILLMLSIMSAMTGAAAGSEPTPDSTAEGGTLSPSPSPTETVSPSGEENTPNEDGSSGASTDAGDAEVTESPDPNADPPTPFQEYLNSIKFPDDCAQIDPTTAVNFTEAEAAYDTDNPIPLYWEFESKDDTTPEHKNRTLELQLEAQGEYYYFIYYGKNPDGSRSGKQLVTIHLIDASYSDSEYTLRDKNNSTWNTDGRFNIIIPADCLLGGVPAPLVSPSPSLEPGGTPPDGYGDNTPTPTPTSPIEPSSAPATSSDEEEPDELTITLPFKELNKNLENGKGYAVIELEQDDDIWDYDNKSIEYIASASSLGWWLLFAAVVVSVGINVVLIVKSIVSKRR